MDVTQQEKLCYYLIEPVIMGGEEDPMHVDIEEQDYVTQFKSILSIFQQFLSHRLDARSPAGDSSSNRFNLNSDEVVIDTTKCIAVLCKRDILC